MGLTSPHYTLISTTAKYYSPLGIDTGTLATHRLRPWATSHISVVDRRNSATHRTIWHSYMFPSHTISSSIDLPIVVGRILHTC